MKYMTKQEALTLQQEVQENYAIELELSDPQYYHHHDKADEEYYHLCLWYGGKDEHGLMRYIVCINSREQWEAFEVLAELVTQRVADYEQSLAEGEAAIFRKGGLVSRLIEEKKSLARINQNMEEGSEEEFPPDTSSHEFEKLEMNGVPFKEMTREGRMKYLSSEGFNMAQKAITEADDGADIF